MTILEEIAAYKKAEIVDRKHRIPRAQLEKEARERQPPRGFHSSLANMRASGRFGLIAEIKKASPSRGIIRSDFDPAALAKAYQSAGAACLSVLTDQPSFRGKLADLTAASAASTLPVLRKDFMLDTYQVVEARAAGADCILVIMAIVEDRLAGELITSARDWHLDVLVEIHDKTELNRALALGAPMIGINNRDLHSFTTDLATTERLVSEIPADRLVVAESGISGNGDLRRLEAAGVTCFLVGESLLRQKDVALATRNLLSG